jgi:hypothetical protein
MSSVLLSQAIHCFARGTEPIPDADFEALGVPPLPGDHKAFEEFIRLGRNGKISLVGTLCRNVADYNVPGQCYLPRADGKEGIEWHKPPRLSITPIEEDIAIPPQELARDRIHFEGASITLKDVTAIPTHLHPKVLPHQQWWCTVEKCRADATELRKLIETYAGQQRQQSETLDAVRLKPGPAPKYDKSKVVMEAGAILHLRGCPEGGLTGLGHELQQTMGDEAPGDTLMKEYLAPFKRHPIWKDAFLPKKSQSAG